MKHQQSLSLELCQRGGGSALTLGVVIIVLLLGFVGATQVGWLSSGARARSVADLVAIAAAQAQQDGQPACEAAEQAAEANNAALSSCELTTGWGEFIVDVSVTVGVRPQLAGAPQTAQAASRAGVVGDIA